MSTFLPGPRESGEGLPAGAEAEQALLGNVIIPPDMEIQHSDTPPELTERLEAFKRGEIGSESFAVILFDADGLKEVNEDAAIGGHEAGNTLLRIIEETLNNATRRRDGGVTDEIIRIVGTATVMRQNTKGDEFMVIIRGAKDQEQVENIARRLQGSLKTRSIPMIAPDGIEVSCGGQIYEGGTADELYRKADSRMIDDKMERRRTSLRRESLVVRRKVAQAALWHVTHPDAPSPRRFASYVDAVARLPIEEIIAMQHELDKEEAAGQAE